MKSVKEKTLKRVANLAEKLARTGGGWPPPCAGFIYQPKRPEFKENGTHTK